MEKLIRANYIVLLILCLVMTSGCATQAYRGKIEGQTYPHDEGPTLDGRVLLPTDKVEKA